MFHLKHSLPYERTDLSWHWNTKRLGNNRELGSESSASSRRNRVGAILLSAGKDQIPTNRGEQGEKEQHFCHFWRPFYGISGKKAATTQMTLLLKNLSLHHEKGYQNEPEFRYPFSRHSSKGQEQKSTGIRWGKLVCSHILSIIMKNIRICHLETAYNGILGRGRVWGIRESDFICPHRQYWNIYKKAFSVL